jgi:Domain of unknown function DUF11
VRPDRYRGLSAFAFALHGCQRKLGPLQNNGGRTKTHALLDGSPAINTGDNTDCPPIDQRGIARFGSPCDVGSYEKSLSIINPVITEPNKTADLLIKLMPVSPQLNIGSPVIYSVYISNNGPDDATGIKIAVVLQGHENKITLIQQQESCEIKKNRLECTIKSIPKRGRKTITFSAILEQLEKPTITATVFGNQGDSNVSNNQDALRVRINSR